jgi:exonuclease III
VFLSEVKGSPLEPKSTKIESRALRLLLFAMGYAFIYFNICCKTPHTHGTAILSRVALDKVEFGMNGDDSDPEGRTITTRHDDSAMIWTYTPCSTMGIITPDKRRLQYNADFKQYILNLQLELGYNNVTAGGDMNVAPTNRHVDRREVPMIHLPSAKKWEQEDYADLLSTTGMRNAATGTMFEYVKTWSAVGPLSFAMSLDHLLRPDPQNIKAGAKAIRIESFEVLPCTFGSDHNAFLFKAAFGESAQVCALKPILDANGLCVYHVCEKHGKPTLVVSGCECGHTQASRSGVCEDAECVRTAIAEAVKRKSNPAARKNEYLITCDKILGSSNDLFDEDE